MSVGALLDGRIRYVQSEEGHRTGIEPVLLASAVRALPGERVLEGGTGAGAGLLCLAARVEGLRGVGVERDAALASIAAGNFADNGFGALASETGDLLAFDPVGRRFDHAFANPPWHHDAGTRSPDASREDARRGGVSLYGDWIRALARCLAPRGTLSVILPAWRLPETLAAAAACGLGSQEILPLWPKVGAAAKLLIVTTRAGGRTPLVLRAGLVLHQADGRFTSEAERILRQGAAFPRE